MKNEYRIIMYISKKLFIFCLVLVALAMACKVPGKLTKKERRELARIERARFVADSIKQVQELARLIKIRESARLDSIRIADSIAALPKINYDTVFVASLLRTPCFGKCPNYEIRLYASGYATYEGLAHVDSIGRYEARVDKSVVEAIVVRANALRYFSLSDHYPAQGRGIEDFPLCVTSFRQENNKKIIYNRNDAPVDLVKYERFFDSAFEEVEWKRIGR